ncbi:hypothetical protein CIHG_02002 [Coccidioides immitis H538.4]|uniref:Uncharacterized protein n=1 Tax=Coccidioides immitis H538.4 TaxID=396776 RepID=A0A0J8RHZ3_COCIT|nr:hypothetical protein CIHG_02002 [Coccidioides immitis H538.4]
MAKKSSKRSHGFLTSSREISVREDSSVPGIDVLSSYGFGEKDVEISREALRCLANALFLEKETRQIFVDLGNGHKAAEKLKTMNS